MQDVVRKRFPVSIYRGLVIDLEDRLRAEALNAFRMVRDHAALDRKRSRELEGQARFRMMEQGFQEVCELYGGTLLEGGILPGPDLKVFQPFMRFGEARAGFVLGLATMPQPGTLPQKNRSRTTGVVLNYALAPYLDLDGTGPQPGDIFILMLVARDPRQAGKIDELAVGVVDATYDQFLFYERLDSYLIEAVDVPAVGAEASEPDSAPHRAVRLKKTFKGFIPPEMPGNPDEGSGTA